MSMMVKSEGNNEIKQLDPGVYTGIASQIIDLGVQENLMFGKQQRKVIIVWNIVGEYVTINDKEVPRVMSKEYTMSLGEKSTLRKDLEAWRGRPFSAEELEGFDLKNVLNVPCQLQLIQKESNGKTFLNIASIMSIPKGMTVEPLEETFIFDTYDSVTWENYDKISKWIKEKIKKALNLAQTQLDLYIADYEEKQKELEGKQQEGTVQPDFGRLEETQTKQDETYDVKKDLPF